jgi:cytochrome c-type biogenesis protein CcmH/NrfG
VPCSTDRVVTMTEENRRPRFRFRIRTLLVVVAFLALILVVVLQQVQIRRQQVLIRQMKQDLSKHMISQEKLTEIIRELRDALDRHRQRGSSAESRSDADGAR